MRTGPRTSSPTCPAGSPPEPSVVLTLTEDVARAVGDRLPLKELEAENARLKNLLAEAEHRHIDAQGPHGGKLLTPNRKRNAVGVLRERFGVSERRGRKVVGIHRSTQRLDPPPVTDDVTAGREGACPVQCAGGDTVARGVPCASVSTPSGGDLAGVQTPRPRTPYQSFDSWS